MIAFLLLVAGGVPPVPPTMRTLREVESLYNDVASSADELSPSDAPHVSMDRFRKETLVASPLLRVSGASGATVGAALIRVGDSNWLVMRFTGEAMPKYEACREVDMLIDGVALHFVANGYLHAAGLRDFREMLLIPVPAKDLMTMAQAKQIDLKVCIDEMSIIGPKARARIAAFAASPPGAFGFREAP